MSTTAVQSGLQLYLRQINHSRLLTADEEKQLGRRIVRELTGGIYFGDPRGIETMPDGTRRGINTEVYTEAEIERVVRAAFELARKRQKRLCEVDKANVMESGLLWREVANRVHADYQDVELSFMYADNSSMVGMRPSWSSICRMACLSLAIISTM